MKLRNSFTIARPTDEVYRAFLDVPRIAGCMPGSTLLGEPEPGTYDGEVLVKVGPLTVSYSGQVVLVETDEHSRRLVLRAKGREQRGAGNADAYVVASLVEDQGTTRVELDTELTIRGKVAQFGRGAIADVTDAIMQTFAANVEQMLAAGADATHHRPADITGRRQEPAGTAAAPAAAPQLDAWTLVVRPWLARNSGRVATVALLAAASYLGARRGSRTRL